MQPIVHINISGVCAIDVHHGHAARDGAHGNVCLVNRQAEKHVFPNVGLEPMHLFAIGNKEATAFCTYIYVFVVQHHHLAYAVVCHLGGALDAVGQLIAP